MLDEIISYHRYMVEILLFVLIVNLALPFLLKQNIEKMVFWTRIGYFAFWMFWSMNIFAGLIVFMFTGRELTLSVIMMIVASVFLGSMDSYRAIKSRRLWLKELDANRFSAMVVLSEIMVIVLVSFYSLQAH
jgi:hypothetical protein